MGLRFGFFSCFLGLADTAHSEVARFASAPSSRLYIVQTESKKGARETHALASALATFLLLLVPVDPELILLPQSNALLIRLVTVCALKNGSPIFSSHAVLVGESELLAPDDWVLIEKCRVVLDEQEGGGVRTEGEREETDGVREMEGAGDICIEEESYAQWCIVGESVRVCCKPSKFWRVEG